MKRGIDAASVAAASQFRKGFVGADLEKAGQEFLKFNEADATVVIHTCKYPNTNWDATLCEDGKPARKLVRVTASQYVEFGFLRIIGINGTNITATSVGEAASLDMVLAIDTSGSQAYETTVGGNPNRSDWAVSGVHAGDDPEACNADPARPCQPMQKIKEVAIAFANQQFYPYDRIALVASTSQTPDGDRNAVLIQPTPNTHFMDNVDASGNPNTEVQDAINGLKVHQPPHCDTTKGPCLIFAPTYQGQKCNPYEESDDPTSCGASNIGGVLNLAGDQFGYARQEAFWVVINLYGGPANATNEFPPSKPDGFCPTTTWNLGAGNQGFCRDLDPMPASYNPPSSNTSDPAWINYVNNYDWSSYNYLNATRHPKPTNSVPSNAYDADDYARDAADYVTSPTKGQGAVLFSICMGSLCKGSPNVGDPASAELLGRYMAEHAGDDLTVSPPVIANHGIYQYAENTTQLGTVFAEIAKNIQTRISK